MDQQDTFSDQVRRVLADLVDVLGRDPHFLWVEELADVIGDGPDAFMSRYCSLEWWGGAGSVLDLWLDTPALTARKNDLLMELVGLFKANGYRCEAAEARLAEQEGES